MYKQFVICDIIFSYSLITPKSKYPRYINDLKIDNFITSKRARKNLIFVKKQHNSALKKIKNVKLQNQRLKNKIKSYDQLIKTLEQKTLVSENATNFLKVIIV